MLSSLHKLAMNILVYDFTAIMDMWSTEESARLMHTCMPYSETFLMNLQHAHNDQTPARIRTHSGCHKVNWLSSKWDLDL